MGVTQDEEVVDALVGASDAEFGDMSLEDIEAAICNAGYERCCECDYWCEAGELADEDGEELPCEACR